MAGFITHQYILCRALDEYNRESDIILERLKKSLKEALKYAKQESGYENYYNYRETIYASAGFAHIGAVGPDLFYSGFLTTGMDYMADLMHYNKTGPYVIFGINNIKKKINELREKMNKLKQEDFNIEDMLVPAELNILAYYMGHASHIAADVVVHPLVNSLIGAYPDLLNEFFDSRGLTPIKRWNSHNIIEHYQDAYVLHYKYPGFFEVADDFFDVKEETKEGVKKIEKQPWKNIMIGIAAANEYINYEEKDKEKYYFILKNALDYYKHEKNNKINPQSMETQKYSFFLDANRVINSSVYFDGTIPYKKTMETWKKVFVQENYFNEHVERAIKLTHEMWDEIFDYLLSDSIAENDEDNFAIYKFFPILRQHWNLDTGIGMSINEKLKSYNPKYDDKNVITDAEIHLVELFFTSHIKERMPAADSLTIEGIIKNIKDGKKEEDNAS